MNIKLQTSMLAACFSAALIGLATAPAYAVHDIDTFELDRNALDGNGAMTLPDDWETLYDSGANTGGHSFAYTGIIDDPTPETSIFTTGGSKDIHDVSSWKWKNASNILDKNNITNAYAAAYNVDGELVIYFGLDRLSNDGSAQVGFWFFKNAIGLNGDGNSGGGDTFSGTHANGDILVQSNFSQGGTVDNVTVFKWQDGALVEIAAGGDCVGGVALGDNVCATVNQGDTTSPWPYTPKSGTDGQFPQGSFFEGGINLSGLGLTDACFSTFMAETRSSQQFDAVLKDFVGPREFETCNIEVTKSCVNPRLNEAQDEIILDIKGSVTASGFGADLFNVALSDNPAADGAFTEVDCDTQTATGNSFPLDSLSGTTCYTNTITVPLTDNGLSDTVTVTANTKSDGTGSALTDSDTAKCPNLQISPALSVSKECDTEVVVDGGLVVAKVNVSGKVCNIGDSNLSNVTVDDLNIVTSPDPLVDNVFLSTPADPNNPTVVEGACVEYTGSYFPSAALDVNDLVTTDPNAVIFKDTVEATGNDIFGDPVMPQMDNAQCPLCD